MQRHSETPPQPDGPRPHAGTVRVELLTRTGCPPCVTAADVLAAVCAEFGLSWSTVDVDLAAAQHPELRAEYGDRLPVVLLDGREHSYLDVDESRLRRDLAAVIAEPDKSVT